MVSWQMPLIKNTLCQHAFRFLGQNSKYPVVKNAFKLKKKVSKNAISCHFVLIF